MYKSNNIMINNIDIKTALKINNEFNPTKIDSSYFEDIDDHKLEKIQDVIISLAKMIEQLRMNGVE